MRLPAGGGSPGLYLPVSTPCASGDQTICEIPCCAQSGMTSRSGPRHSIEYCGWLETNFSTFGQLERLLDLVGRPLAEAEVARLALPHDLGERLHRLLERRVPVVAVALVEVDVVRAQPRERDVDLLEDLLAREALVGVGHRAEELRREDVRVARSAVEHLAEELLRAAAVRRRSPCR